MYYFFCSLHPNQSAEERTHYRFGFKETNDIRHIERDKWIFKKSDQPGADKGSQNGTQNNGESVSC